MISPKEIRASFKARTKPAETMTPDGNTCMVRLLSASLLKDAEVAAYCELAAEAKKRGFDVASFVDVDASTLDLERKIQLIHRAFVQDGSEGPESPVFIVGHLREYDSVYLGALFDLYLDHQDRSDCRDDVVDDEALDSIVTGIVDDVAADRILGRISPKGLRRIARALATRLREVGDE